MAVMMKAAIGGQHHSTIVLTFIIIVSLIVS